MVSFGPGQAAAAPGDAKAPAPWPRGGTASVTLITGDRVLVGEGQHGQPSIQVLPSGAGATFRTWGSGSDYFVVPSSVDRLVPRVLDPDLFNVTKLVRAKLDDANSTALPLLVQHEPAARPSALDAGGPLAASRELRSINASATRLDKAKAGELRPALTGAQRQAAAGRADRIEGGPLAGVRHVWLDAPIQPMLDANLTQIGAPTAWNSGLSGSGVKVAVLDTGIDANHPDLAGQVVAAADFTGTPDPGDRIGHGTHVAAIVAGTGVRSGGQRKGVAFGARLLNGKVIGENGNGTVSTAIAGMEWAVQQGADVVNMSIGLNEPSDGTDPWSLAVNQLTQSSGTLFVVSAGNNGPIPVKIGAPASADAALTVAAVNGSNQPAEFSSPGPRLGDRALKPDISAPGVEIISARAAGTVLDTPIDDNYVRASGTSMASPHVAGAAALLAQRNPTWTPAQLKAVLMGTTQPASGVSGYVQGAGRVDLAHAIDQKVLADVSNVDFRGVPANSAAVTRTVTLRNTGTSAVTVNAALSVRNTANQAAPSGLFTVSPAQVSLPAGGTGTVTVRLTPSASAAGVYSGGLTLTPNSGRALRVPVGAAVTPPVVNVTFRGIGRDGAPASNGLLAVWNVDDAALSPIPVPVFGLGSVPLDANGETTIPVVAGRYSTMSMISNDGLATASFVGSLETTINQSGTIVLDARTAQSAHASVDGINLVTPVGLVGGYTRLDRFGRPFSSEVFSSSSPGNALTFLFAQPTAPVTTGQVETRLLFKVTGTDADGPAEVVVPQVDTVFRNPPNVHVTSSQLATYAQIEADYRALGNDPWAYGVSQQMVTPVRGLVGVGSLDLTFPVVRTEYIRPDSRLTWRQCVASFVQFGPPVTEHCELATSARPAGSRVSKRWLAGPLDPVLKLSRTADTLSVVTASPHGDGDGRSQESVPFIGLQQSSFQVFRDGVPITWIGRFGVPTDRPSVIRMDGVFDLDPNAVSVPSSTRVSWKFTTRPPSGSAAVTPPILLADVRAPGLDARNFAAAGAPLAIEVDAHTVAGATPVAVSWVETFASADNGQTWQWVTLTRGSDGIYRGQIPASQVVAGGAVGLRVRAGDAEGNTVEQTQLHAVRVAS